MVTSASIAVLAAAAAAAAAAVVASGDAEDAFRLQGARPLLIQQPCW